MVKARKRFGQNFLVDDSVIDRIVSSIHAQATDTLAEIGPGHGALTKPLLLTQAKLHCVELDRDLIPGLEKLAKQYNQLSVQQADALTVDFSALNNNLRVVGNLPYNISTPLLFHLLNAREHIQDMHFMVQHEVAARITAEVGTKQYGRLSVMLQYYCEAAYLFHVPPTAFDPPPKVDSAIIRLIPRKTLAPACKSATIFEEIVKLAFSQRRKTLRNTLKSELSAEQIQQTGIDPSLRAEQITPEQFVNLANVAVEHGSK